MWSLSLFGTTLDFDKVKKESESAKAIIEECKGQTGSDRLRYMFTTDEFGTMSPELTSVLHTGFLGTFLGGMFGGFVQSRTAYINFMENNQATTFTNHLEAKKKLQDAVTISFGKGAFKWGWRVGAFSTSYIMIVTSISTYRGKSSILEHVIGAGVTGVMYKAPHGPRGMIVGGLLGSCLGAVAGAISLGILKLTGMTMEEVRYWQYHFYEHRQSKFGEAIKKYKTKEDLELVRRHGEKTDGVPPSLDNIQIENK